MTKCCTRIARETAFPKIFAAKNRASSASLRHRKPSQRRFFLQTLTLHSSPPRFLAKNLRHKKSSLLRLSSPPQTDPRFFLQTFAVKNLRPKSSPVPKISAPRRSAESAPRVPKILAADPSPSSPQEDGWGRRSCSQSMGSDRPRSPSRRRGVLGSFLSDLNKFIADRYSSNHSVAEYFVYELFKVWKCSRAEADIRVHEFFKTSYFKSGIFPIPGAQHALRNLSTFCNLFVVTSRQNVIKDHTLEWIEEHYPDLFQEIHFGNHFALNGVSRPKSEICRSLGAHVLINDNPKYALECAEIGIRVLLFYFDNSYPWCKSGSANSHPLVMKVHNWQEVELQLL